MSQNLISLSYSAEQIAAIEQTLITLESQLSGLVSLDTDERKRLARMGGKSQEFCRETLVVLKNNPQIVPPSLSLAEAQADLATLDTLRPIVHRLQQLAERAQDTDVALGSDVMDFALDGYALLKVAGRSQGLEALRKALSSRFARAVRATVNPPVAEPA